MFKKRRRRGRNWRRERRKRKWMRRRRHFTQAVKIKNMNIKQGCTKFVKHAMNPSN